MKTLVRGLSQVLFVIAGVVFFGGGILISVLTKTERVTAEMAGIAVAVVLGIFGMVAHRVVDYMDDGEDHTSTDQN